MRLNENIWPQRVKKQPFGGVTMKNLTEPIASVVEQTWILENLQKLAVLNQMHLVSMTLRAISVNGFMIVGTKITKMHQNMQKYGKVVIAPIAW